MKDAIIESISAIALAVVITLTFIFGGMLFSAMFVVTLGLWLIAVVDNMLNGVLGRLSSLFSRSEATREREEK